MDNISEIPYQEWGLAIVVENPVRQVSSSIMGMFRRKGISGPHESYDIVGYLMGGFKGKLKGSKSLRKFANI